MATDHPEKVLRGLPVDELERLINRMCKDGKRIDVSNWVSRETEWEYEIMGVKLRLHHYRGASDASFRLIGPRWVITFRGRGSIWGGEQDRFTKMHIGPFDVTLSYNQQVVPGPEYVFTYHWRRRGDLSLFKHDMSLIRLAL